MRRVTLSSSALAAWRSRTAVRFTLAVAAAIASLLVESWPVPARADSGVSTFNGIYLYSYTDVSLAGPGGGAGLKFTRVYGSNYFPVGPLLGPIGGARGWPLGIGWTHSYNMRVTFLPDSSDLALWGPLNRVDRYRRQPDGRLEPPPAIDTQLAQNADGTYTATHADGGTWTFNNAGRLTRVTDAQGRTTSLTYDQAAQLVAISDPYGRGDLQLDYDPATGQLVRVSDWFAPPRVVEYGYDDYGRLARVTDREQQTTHFEYEGIVPGRAHLLTQITDARGHEAIRIEYDARGRAATRWDARGVTTGQTRTMQFDERPDGTRVTTHTYPPSAYTPSWRHETRDTFDQAGRHVERVERPTPNETYIERYTYDARSSRIAVADATGNPVPQRGEHEWEAASCAPPTTVEDPNLILAGVLQPLWGLQPGPRGELAVSYDYDEVGRLRSLGVPATAAAAALTTPGTWRFTYDREDRLRGIIAPPDLPGGAARLVALRYDPVGNLNVLVDFSGQVTRFAYDERDSLHEVKRSPLPWTDPDAEPTVVETTTYDYDDRGHLERITRAAGGQVVERFDLAFDGLHRLRTVTSFPALPDTSRTRVTSFAYDAQGACSSGPTP